MRQARSYEEQIYQAIVRSGDFCFDVGANAGEVSIFLAQLAGESGSVIAFEPVWPLYVRLCRAIELNADIRAPIVAVPLGLADSERRATVNVPNGEFGMGSIAESAAWADVQRGAQISSFEVSLTTLDDFLRSTSLLPPTFMKIDVEGAELFVFRGATKLFDAGYRPLMLIEVFAPWEHAFGYRPWDVLSWLTRRDYRFLFACPHGLIEHVPTWESPFPAEYEMGYNIVAYQPESHLGRIDRLQYLRATSNPPLLPMVSPPRRNHVLERE
jgi:FkbM family methyltransferase